MPTKKRIVIIGGGFAGLHLAKALSRNKFHVVLIDRENHHMFQPLFYQVATARIEPSNISFPFRKLFQTSKHVEFLLAEVIGIDDNNKQIQLPVGKVSYDILVIATGCNTNFFGNRSIQQHAFAMKTTAEAIELRNALLLNFERYINKHSESENGLLNIVIVGAGPTGVELAGSYAEMKHKILPRDYPFNDFSKMRVILIDGGKTALGAMSQHAQLKAMQYLEQLGVELIMEHTVESYNGNELVFTNGSSIRSKTVIWAAGVTGNVIQGLDRAEFVRNRFKVNRYNCIIGYNHVYALGDIAYMETPRYPSGHPQLANVAINQAKNLAKNLNRGGDLADWQSYEYKDLGSMATIGKHKAVVDIGRIRFGGKIAWFVWMFLHLMLILSVRNKLKIFINWAWNYFVNDSSLRLIFLIKGKKIND